MTAERFCEQLADAECRQIFNGGCFDDQERREFGKDQADCASKRKDKCLSENKEKSNSGFVFDADRANSCVDKIDVMACEDYRMQTKGADGGAEAGDGGANYRMQNRQIAACSQVFVRTAKEADGGAEAGDGGAEAGDGGAEAGDTGSRKRDGGAAAGGDG